MGKMIDEMKADRREFHLHTMLALSKRPAEERAVWVVDQFEEVFTLCRNEEERSSFIDSLLFASSVSNGRSVMLLTMRADFYHRCLEHAGLARAIADHQYTVVAMNEENLRQAIEEPDRQVGLSVDPELTDEILRAQVINGLPLRPCLLNR
jgi:Novel STAND NTPase 1